MDILGTVSNFVTGGISDVVGIVSNPGSALLGIVYGAIGLALLVPAMDIIFRLIDAAIFWVDDVIIDNIPIKSVKKTLQDRLVNRLNKRINRYTDIIKRISD